MLVVEYKNREKFRDEFVDNIARGGLFIPTSSAIELRSIVDISVALSYCDEQIQLRGEVVHCIPEVLRSESVTPGVAVQIDLSSQEIYERFGPFLNIEEVEPVKCAGESQSESDMRDRRDSPRHPARIQARLCLASGEELQGFTRNLSATGILFSVMGDAPEIGTHLSVGLLNPVSLEAIEIQSRVARHVEGEAGDIPAIGVRFCPDASDIEGTNAFLEHLGASEHSRRLGGISGDLAELSIASLVQSFCLSTASGTITLMRGQDEGFIAFEETMLVACRVGRVGGLKALARMLAWQDGHFEFHARIEPELIRDEPILLDAAILEALRELDESHRDACQSFAPALCFDLDRGAAVSLSEELGKTEAAIVDLLGVGANVRRLLDVIPESDAKIYGALTGLVDLGVIRPRS
jgi:Tfp pilus assembly protein PilZ